MSWNDMFVNMGNTNFFNFSFLPKYAGAFVRGFEYTLLLAVVSVLLAVIPALLLALMRLSKNRFIIHRSVPLHSPAGTAVHHLLRFVPLHSAAPDPAVWLHSH